MSWFDIGFEGDHGTKVPTLRETAEIVGLKSFLHGLKIHAMGIQGGANSFDPQCGSLGSCGLV